MSTLTPNYNLIKPGVNDPTDEDLWGGYLNTDLDIIDTEMKNIADTAGRLPVGSLYFNADVATNPATLLGYGTWVAFAEGRCIIGVGTGTDANGTNRSFTNGATGGEYTHTQTIAEMPSHSHAQRLNTGSGPTSFQTGTGTTLTTVDPTTGDTGGGGAMEWMQPYIALYIWKRTA